MNVMSVNNPKLLKYGTLAIHSIRLNHSSCFTYKSCNRKFSRVQQIPTVCYTRPGTFNTAVPS